MSVENPNFENEPEPILPESEERKPIETLEEVQTFEDLSELIDKKQKDEKKREGLKSVIATAREKLKKYLEEHVILQSVDDFLSDEKSLLKPLSEKMRGKVTELLRAEAEGLANQKTVPQEEKIKDKVPPPIQPIEPRETATPRNLYAKVELPLPSSPVPTQENVESGEVLEGNQLWRYLKKNEKGKNLGMVATDFGFSGNDWIAFLQEDDGSVRAVQIYSAGSYDEKFIKRIVGFGETSKYSSNSGLETADAICKKLEKKK